MTRDLDQDELVDCWTLVDNEPELVARKRGAAKLGFAVMLRFYTERGRFPRGRAEIPSEIGFGFTKLLGFDLLPRIKRINKVKLYRPAAGEPDLWPGLKPAMTRPINWTKIAE